MPNTQKLFHSRTYLNSVFGKLGCHVHGGPHPALIPLPGVRVEGEAEIDNLFSGVRMPGENTLESGGREIHLSVTALLKSPWSSPSIQ